MTFDLTGLPPTPAEIDAFLQDDKPDALAKVVDRLLASEHYGEHWGRHWLDLARYADSGHRWSFAYRDYVIRAFNEDLPFDQFVLQQLAADLLPSKEDDQAMAALGFLTVGDQFFAEFDNLHDVMDDRIDAVTRGMLGLTVSCARCHDHKYDPISQEDYYALYGVFRSSVEPLVPPRLSPPADDEQHAAYQAELDKRVGEFRDYVERTHATLISEAKRRTAEYLMEAHAQREHPETEGFLLLQSTEDELHPEVLRRWRVYLRRTDEQLDPVWLPWHALGEIPVHRFAQDAAATVDRLAQGDGDTAGPNPLVLQALDTPLRSMQEVADAYAKLLLRIDQQWKQWTASSAADDKWLPERLADDANEQLRQIFYGRDAPPNLPNIVGPRFIFNLRYEPGQAEFHSLLEDVNEWVNFHELAPDRAPALVDAETLFEPRVFRRGNPTRPGQPVPRRFLSILDETKRPFVQGSGRLELARAIVALDNPLTARVIVNRIWQHHFGAGLVRTPSDFGTRSESPSHPELLDHLATSFVLDGWSIKQLHRKIMLSAVYQQQSVGRNEARQADPDNRMLWRMNRRRLSFESMRDSLLVVADRLDPTVGGPPDERILFQLGATPLEEDEEIEPLDSDAIRAEIADLEEALAQAREDDNEVEVAEIGELIQELEQQLQRRTTAASAIAIATSHAEVQEMLGDPDPLHVESLYDSVERVWFVVYSNPGGDIAVAIVSVDGELVDYARFDDLVSEMQALREAGEQEGQEAIEYLLARISTVREAANRGQNRSTRRARLLRELEDARAGGNEQEVREIQALLKELANEPAEADGDETENRREDLIDEEQADEDERFNEERRNLEHPVEGPAGEDGVLARRMVYAFIERGAVPKLLRAFDFPNPAASVAKRVETTTPPQALFLMNNVFVRQAARGVALRPDLTKRLSIREKTIRVHRLLFARRPDAAELSAAEKFLGDTPGIEEWTNLIQALLMTNEFVYID